MEDGEMTGSKLPTRINEGLFEAVYARLKAMAGNQLSRGYGESISTTALVHELYLKMSASPNTSFGNPAQFYDYAAKAMRHIMIDRARARIREKRGGSDLVMVELSTSSPSLADFTAERALEVDDALRHLEKHAPRAAKIVELHFFAGLPLDTIADQLGISTRTVNREWRFARALLHGTE